MQRAENVWPLMANIELLLAIEWKYSHIFKMCVCVHLIMVDQFECAADGIEEEWGKSRDLTETNICARN